MIRKNYHYRLIVTHHPTDCVNRLYAFSGKRYPDRHRMHTPHHLGENRLPPYTKALLEHYWRIALEATLDLGRHIIAPQEYRDVGNILREKEILSPELGQKLEAITGMRNVLVHLYRDIDYPLLYSIIVERLNSFEQFLEQIFLYLDQLEGE